VPEGTERGPGTRRTHQSFAHVQELRTRSKIASLTAESHISGYITIISFSRRNGKSQDVIKSPASSSAKSIPATRLAVTSQRPPVATEQQRCRRIYICASRLAYADRNLWMAHDAAYVACAMRLRCWWWRLPSTFQARTPSALHLPRHRTTSRQRPTTASASRILQIFLRSHSPPLIWPGPSPYCSRTNLALPALNADGTAAPQACERNTQHTIYTLVTVQRASHSHIATAALIGISPVLACAIISGTSVFHFYLPNVMREYSPDGDAAVPGTKVCHFLHVFPLQVSAFRVSQRSM
jgi:hypothetical protein